MAVKPQRPMAALVETVFILANFEHGFFDIEVSDDQNGGKREKRSNPKEGRAHGSTDPS